MSTPVLAFKLPLALAIALGATTPAPTYGGAALGNRGSQVWSITEGCYLQWNGSSWQYPPVPAASLTGDTLPAGLTKSSLQSLITVGATPLVMGTNSAERMRVAADGKLLVNMQTQANADAIVQILHGGSTGSILVRNQIAAGAASVLMQADGAGGFHVGLGNTSHASYPNSAFLIANSANPVIFGNKNVERWRMDPDGRLLIGMSTPYTGLGEPLQVNGGIVSLGVRSGANGKGFIIMQPGTDAFSGYMEFYNADGTRHGYIGFASGKTGSILLDGGGNGWYLPNSDSLGLANGSIWMGTTGTAIQVGGNSGTQQQVNIRNDVQTGATLAFENRLPTTSIKRIGSILFSSYRDVSTPSYVAAIWVEGSGNVGNYGEIVFGTSQNGTAAFPVERMRMNATGQIGLALQPVANANLYTTVVLTNCVQGGSVPAGFFGANPSDGFVIDTDKFIPSYGMTWKQFSDVTAGPSGAWSAYGGIRFYTQQIERMRIDFNGNVSVNQTFTGNGDIRAANRLMALAPGQTAPGAISGDVIACRADGSAVYYMGPSGSRFLYWNGGSYRMPNGRLYSDEQLVPTVGHDNYFNSVSYFKSTKGGTNIRLGTSNTYGLEAYSDDGGPAAMSFHRAGYYAVNMGLDPDNVFRLGGWSAGANRLQLDMSGNLTVAGAVTPASDRRLKANLTVVATPLTVLKGMSGYTYNRIDPGSDKTKRQAGVIAQEVLAVFPECVYQGADGMYAVNYNGLMAALIEAIKALDTRTTTLATRLGLGGILGIT